MKVLLLVLLLTLLFISQINTILDIDLWWNLKAGEYILQNLKVPHIDIFSYTLKDKPWIDHEWLSQVLFYPVFSRFGWQGLNILKAFIVSLSFFIVLFLASSGFKRLRYAVSFMLLSVLAFNYRSVVRPEIFSYLFLCIFLYILETNRRPYLLPFLQIIWVNMHGYFILGPVLLAFYCIGSRERVKRYLPIFIKGPYTLCGS